MTPSFLQRVRTLLLRLVVFNGLLYKWKFSGRAVALYCEEYSLISNQDIVLKTEKFPVLGAVAMKNYEQSSVCRRIYVVLPILLQLLKI